MTESSYHVMGAWVHRITHNEKCIHCYAHYPTCDASSDHLSISQYQGFIDELYESGALHIAFTGGDPFMNKLFLEVFEYSRFKGFVADIFTNGLWLAAHPKELKETPPVFPLVCFLYRAPFGAGGGSHGAVGRRAGVTGDTTVRVKQ